MRNTAPAIACIVSLSLAACSVCYNGRGIGCGNGGFQTLEETEAEQKANGAKLQKQLDRSFVIQLARGANVSADQSTPGLTVALETERQKADVGALLDTVLQEIQGLARAHNEDDLFRHHFTLPERLPRLRLSIVDRGVAPSANCGAKAIEVPVRFVRDMLRGGLGFTIRGNLSTAAVPSGPFYPGSVVRSFPGSPLGQFAESTSLMNTAVYRTVIFVLAHEAAHAWSAQCTPSQDPDVQKRREADADLFATIIASELYSSKCKTPFRLNAETFLEIVREEKRHEDLGQLVADRMTEMQLNRFLVAGGGDVQFLFDSLGDSVDYDDPSHPLPGLRVSVDLRARKLMIRQFYNDIHAETKASLITRVFVPKENRDAIYEGMKVGVVGVVYQEYLSDDLLKCSVGTFRSTLR